MPSKKVSDLLVKVDWEISFPISEKESDYWAGRMRKITGMTPEAIKAIDDLKPFYRADAGGIGNPALYWLHAINNLDKHRLLIPAWGAVPARSISKARRAELGDFLRTALGSEDAKVMVPSLVDSNVPLEDGSKLCTVPREEAHDRIDFKFHLGGMGGNGGRPDLRDFSLIST